MDNISDYSHVLQVIQFPSRPVLQGNITLFPWQRLIMSVIESFSENWVQAQSRMDQSAADLSCAVCHRASRRALHLHSHHCQRILPTLKNAFDSLLRRGSRGKQYYSAAGSRLAFCLVKKIISGRNYTLSGAHGHGHWKKELIHSVLINR